MGNTVVGERIYLVRVARGQPRRPESQRAFAKVLTKASGRPYYNTTISEMERGDRRICLDDVEVIASVDPLGRGPAWIAGWESNSPESTVPVMPYVSPDVGPATRTAAGSGPPSRPKRRR